MPTDKALEGLLDIEKRLMESEISREDAKKRQIFSIGNGFRTSPIPGQSLALAGNPGRILVSWECGDWTPLWISPSTRSLPIQSSVKPEHSRTPSLRQNVLGNCGTWAIPNLSRFRVLA
jgi:hypothetical protein